MTKILAPAISALSAGTEQKNFGTVVFSNSNNVTFGLNGSVITASANAAGVGDGYNIIAAGSQTAATSGSVVFSNSNGISFGMSNSSIITASHNGLTSQSNQAISAANGSFTFQTASFADSNGVSFSTGTQGIYATVKTDYLTTQSGQAFSAGGGSSTFQTLSFSNANGISFSNNAGQVQASYTVPTITNSSWTVSDNATSGSVARLAFTNLNGVTLSLSTGAGGSHTIVGSHNALTSQSNQALSGSNGSFTFQTATLGNLNGASFYTSNGSMVLSYTVPSVPAQTNQTLGIYASSQTTGQSSSSTFDARSLSFRGAGIVSVGASAGEWIISATGAGGADGVNILAAGTQTANTTGTVLFNDANGITFGMNNSSVITASHNGLTSQSNQALSGSNGSFAFQTATFGNLNGLSFYTSNGSMVGSYTVPSVTNSSWTVSDNGTSGSVARLAFTNLNGVTLSLSTGAGGSHTIVGSHNALTSQSNQAFSASGGSSAFQTLNFANSNGLTFSNSNGSVIASYTVPTQTNQTIGFYASSNTTAQSSSSTFDARSLTFRGVGIASVGASAGEIVISVPSGGGAGDGVNILAAGTQTANTTGTVVFSNSNNISFGMSNSSVVTASYAENTTSFWDPFFNGNASSQTIGNATLNFRVASLPWHVSFDRHIQAFSYSQASNSTLTVSMSISVGIFTKNNSTLSLISSTSSSISINGTGTASSSNYVGVRLVSIPWSMSLSSGVYHLGFWSRTSTAGANASLNNVLRQPLLAAVSGFLGSGSNSRSGLYPGQGFYNTSFSTAMPSSVDISAINAGQSAYVHYSPLCYFTNGTV